MTPLARRLAHLGVLVASLAACTHQDAPGAVGTSTEDATRTSENGRVGVHGMLLFGGKNSTYLSHVPMFQGPHDLQVVLEVVLEGASLPRTFQDRLYSFVPERMSLDDVVRGARTGFAGTLFLGHFEQGGRPIASGVRVDVRRIALSRNLDVLASEPDRPEYLFIGKAPDTTRVRIIHSADKSADEITPFEVAGGSGLSDEQLASGLVAIAVPPDDATPGAGGEPTASYQLETGVRFGGTLAARPLSCLVAPDFISPCSP